MALHNQGKGTQEIAAILGISKPAASYHKSMLGVAEQQAAEVDWHAVADDIALNMKRNDILKKYGIGANRFNAAIANGLIPSRQGFKFDPAIHLVEGSTIRRGTVKKYLIEEGILENKCALCPQGSEWNGKPLVLALDHENGISNDNRLSNLRLLCPNCHSQTETFAGRNARRKT